MYERALVEIHLDEKSEQLLIAFARYVKYIVSYYIPSYHIPSYYIPSYYIPSYYIPSYYIPSYYTHLYCILFYYVMLCHVLLWWLLIFHDIHWKYSLSNSFTLSLSFHSHPLRFICLSLFLSLPHFFYFLLLIRRFEERSKEFDRARVIYKFALENTAKEENVRELNKEFIAFEKRHGNRYFCCLIVQFIWVSEYLDI